eukprot:5032679-Amphidinium_carterae.2
MASGALGIRSCPSVSLNNVVCGECLMLSSSKSVCPTQYEGSMSLASITEGADVPADGSPETAEQQAACTVQDPRPQDQKVSNASKHTNRKP